MKILKSKYFLMTFILVLIISNVIVVNIAAKEKDKAEDQLIERFNKEFKISNSEEKLKVNKKAVKISERLKVKDLILNNDEFIIEDSKDKIEYIFLQDENNEAVGISAVVNDQMMTMTDVESEMLYKVYQSFEEVYKDQKKINVYALPTFMSFSFIVEKKDGSIDIWPCEEMCNIQIGDVGLEPYAQYAADEFLKLYNEQVIINNELKFNSEGELTY